MERPFTPGERQGLIDACGWLFDGKEDSFLPPAGPLPDADDPWTLIQDWHPWIEECLVLLDGDGRFRHLPYANERGASVYREQPAFDMSVFQTIRGEWNRLQNAKIQERTNRGVKR